MLRSRRRLLVSIGLLCLMAPCGCGVEKTTVVLTEDDLEQQERQAIERLKESGCECVTADDPWLETSGVLVTLHAEHIQESGRIRPEIFAEFRYLRRLFLVVDQTQMTTEGFADLRRLDNLLLLSAQQTPMDDAGLAQVEGIVSLRLLRLNWTSVSDNGLRHVERLPQLIMLYLSGTRVTDKAIGHLTALRRLTSLQLGHTEVTDAGVAGLVGMKSLTHLSLSHTKITASAVESLGKLVSLKYINLTGTDLEPETLQALRTALPECQVDVRLTAADSDIRRARR